jgi:2-hydroxy-3-keto-5-methylthiopentenyl-1-phosphate phosphatase
MKADLKADVKDIQQEIKKGKKADNEFIARRLRNIKRMAPEILEVVVATIVNPVFGLSVAAKKVAEKIKATA